MVAILATIGRLSGSKTGLAVSVRTVTVGEFTSLSPDQDDVGKVFVGFAPAAKPIQLEKTGSGTKHLPACRPVKYRRIQQPPPVCLRAVAFSDQGLADDVFPGRKKELASISHQSDHQILKMYLSITH